MQDTRPASECRQLSVECLNFNVDVYLQLMVLSALSYGLSDSGRCFGHQMDDDTDRKN